MKWNEKVKRWVISIFCLQIDDRSEAGSITKKHKIMLKHWAFFEFDFQLCIMPETLFSQGSDQGSGYFHRKQKEDIIKRTS